MGNIASEAKAGNYAVIKQALDTGTDVNEKDSNGDTALLWAIAKKRLDIIHLLLDHDADVYLANPVNGTTPLEFSRTSFSEAYTLIQAAANKPRETEEGWAKMGAATVAHVGTYLALGKKITSIFNFTSRDRTIISENLPNGTQTMGPSVSFDVLPREAVEQALDEFEKAGGKANRDFVLKGISTLDKPKIKALSQS